MGPIRYLSITLAFLSSACSCEPRSLTTPDDTSPKEDSGIDPNTLGSGGNHAASSDASGLGSNDAAPSGGDAGDASMAPQRPEAQLPPGLELEPRIPTSGRHLVFEIDDDEDGTLLFALDLETGEAHDLAPGARVFSAVALSPDRRTLLFSARYEGGVVPMRVAHVLEDGLIPATALDGYESSAVSTSVAWTANSRFAVVGTDGQLLVIDAHVHALHGSIKPHPERKACFAQVALEGPWLTYSVGYASISSTPLSTAPVRSGLARITDDGVEWHDQEDTFHAELSPDGRLATHGANDGAGLMLYELSEDITQRLVPVEGNASERIIIEGFLDRDHVLARFTNELGISDDREISVVDGTVFDIGKGDGMGTVATPLTDPEQLLVSPGMNGSGRMLLVDRTSAWPDLPLESAVLGTEFQPWRLEPYGPRHLFYWPSVPLDAGPIEAWILARGEGGELESVKVSAEGSSSQRCSWSRGHAALRSRSGDEVVFVDLSMPSARRAAAIAPMHGGKLACPVWSGDATTFAIVEQLSSADGDARSFIQLGRWAETAAAPELSEIIHEGEGLFRAVRLD